MDPTDPNIKEIYILAARQMRSDKSDRKMVIANHGLEVEFYNVSDLLENAVTMIEVIQKYLHSVDPLISKRCPNCGQKLRVTINEPRD